MVRRRRFLLGLAAAAAVAGCTNASNESNDDTESGDESTTNTSETSNTPGTSETPSDESMAADLVAADDGGYTVDVSGSSDGSVTVTDDAIEFTAPVEKTWNLRGFQNGVPINGGPSGGGSRTPTDTADEPPLKVGPTLDPEDDAQHAFATPIYDAEADRFELRFYVDRTYRDTHDEHYVVWGPGSRANLDSRKAEFTERVDGVYRATLTYDEPVSADMAFPFGTLLDRPLSAVTPSSSRRPPFTAVGVSPKHSRYGSAEAPQVSFGFEYDGSDGTVTVTHEAGDTVSGSNLTIWLAGEPVGTSFEGEVTAGDSVTVDVSGAPSGATMRIVWDSGDASATLARYELP